MKFTVEPNLQKPSKTAKELVSVVFPLKTPPEESRRAGAPVAHAPIPSGSLSGPPKPVQERISEVIVPPQEWHDHWNEFQRARWESMGPDERKEFISFHSQGLPTCRYCKQPVEYIPCPSFGRACNERRRPSVCDLCSASHRRPEKSEVPTSTWWDRNCPDDLRNFDISLMPNVAAYRRVYAWNYQPHGMVLHGVSHRGKTRSVWELLRKISAENRSLKIIATDGTSWGDECAARFKDNTVYDWLEEQFKADLLFIDDLDKLVHTDRVEAEVFRIFKLRCERQLPTIFTTNLVEEKLRARFANAEIAAAFLERVFEYCEDVPF